MLLQTYCWYFLQKQKGYFQQMSMQLFSIKLQFNSNNDCQTREKKKKKKKKVSLGKMMGKYYAEIVVGL